MPLETPPPHEGFAATRELGPPAESVPDTGASARVEGRRGEPPLSRATEPEHRRPGRRQARALTAVVLLMALAYACCLSALAIRAHLGLQTQMNDLGNADQALWRAAHGDWRMVVSNDLYGELRSRFGIHANLIFLPLAALYRLWSDPRLLLVLASAACAAAAVGLYRVARHRLGESWWALLPPAAFVASPMVHDANLYDFHVTTLTAALLVWTIWAFQRDRPALAYPLLVLMMTCKEDAPFLGLLLGLVLMLEGRTKRGAVVAGLAVAYIVVVLGFVLPGIDDSVHLQAGANRYLGLLQDPAAVLTNLLQPDRLRVPLYLLASGLAFGLRGWRYLPLLLPPVAAGLLSGTLWTTRITGTYYWITCEAVIVLACIDAAARARPSAGGPRRGPLVGLGVATAVSCCLLSPLPLGIGATWENFAVDGSHATLAALAGQIPAADAVSVQNNLGPHLAQRDDVASYPRRSASADWVLLRVGYWGGPCSGMFVRTTPRFTHGMELQDLVESARGLIASAEWGTVAASDGFYLFRRGASDTVPDEAARGALDRDAAQANARYLEATNHLSPIAGITVGRLRWRDLARGELLRPGALPGDPVGFRQRLGVGAIGPPGRSAE